MKAFRQGDVPMFPVSEIPFGAKKVAPKNGRSILQYGERTGHFHSFPASQAEVHEKDGNQYVCVMDSAKTEFMPESVSVIVLDSELRTKSLQVQAEGLTYRLPFSEMERVEAAIKNLSILTYPGAAITHQEHDAIIVPPGIYTNFGQQEYTSAMMAPIRVAD